MRLQFVALALGLLLCGCAANDPGGTSHSQAYGTISTGISITR